MAGNKSDNGVHEIGTNDILASYQADTPGEIETKYLDNVNEYIKKGEGKKKEQVKAHFSMIFDNPLQGYPYNEQYGMDKTLEEKTILNTGEQKKVTMAIQKATGSKEVDNEGDKFNAGSSMDIDIKKDSDGDFEIEFNYGTDGVEHLETGIKGFNNLTKVIAQLSKKFKKKLVESSELNEGPKLAQIVRKHKAALMKAKKTGDLILPDKAEQDLSIWAMNNGEIHGDEEDEFIDWLDTHLDDLVPTLKIR